MREKTQQKRAKTPLEIRFMVKVAIHFKLYLTDILPVDRNTQNCYFQQTVSKYTRLIMFSGKVEPKIEEERSMGPDSRSIGAHFTLFRFNSKLERIGTKSPLYVSIAR